MSPAEWYVNPLAIVQVQNCRGWNGGVSFGMLPVEGRGHEHSHPHNPWVWHLDSNFCGTEVGIENRQNVIDPALQGPIGIRIQADVGGFADLRGVKVVFVNVANNPDIRQIRNGEGIGSGQTLNPGW